MIKWEYEEQKINRNPSILGKLSVIKGRNWTWWESYLCFCFVICSVLCLLCFVHVCLYVLCGHLLGKGWPLGSRLWCLLWVCHFPIGILGQVWYLIVSIHDLCTITYFYTAEGLGRCIFAGTIWVNILQITLKMPPKYQFENVVCYIYFLCR